MSFSEMIGERLTNERRLLEVFRKGVVEKIDQSVVPWLATINGRPMPYIDESLAEGEVVFYVDQPDPFAWARIVDEIPGTFPGFRLNEDGNTHYGVWSPSLPDSVVVGDTAEFPPIPQVSQTFGFEQWEVPALFFAGYVLHEDHPDGQIASFLADDALDLSHNFSSYDEKLYPDLVNPVFLMQNMDRAITLVTADGPRVEDEDIPPGTFQMEDQTYVPDGGLLAPPPESGIGIRHAFHVVLNPCHSIRSSVVATEVIDALADEKVYFPAMSVPGPDWLIVWLLTICPAFAPEEPIDIGDYVLESYSNSIETSTDWDEYIDGLPFDDPIWDTDDDWRNAHSGPLKTPFGSPLTDFTSDGDHRFLWGKSFKGFNASETDYIPWVRFDRDVRVTVSTFLMNSTDADL